MDPYVLNFSLVDISILQHLALTKQEPTRYKLMQMVFNTIGAGVVSIPKFYRHVERLQKRSFLSIERDQEHHEENSFVRLTEKGLIALSNYKRIIGQVGINVISIFENQIDFFIKFAGYKGGKVLFVDFPELFDINFLSLIHKISDELSILANDETFKILKSTIGKIQQVSIVENTIIVPENYFSFIFCFFPTKCLDLSIFGEFARVLKPHGSIILADNLNPLENTDHYVIQILVRQFWPFDLINKPKLEEIMPKIMEHFPNFKISELSSMGLELKQLSSN